MLTFSVIKILPLFIFYFPCQTSLSGSQRYAIAIKKGPTPHTSVLLIGPTLPYIQLFQDMAWLNTIVPKCFMNKFLWNPYILHNIRFIKPHGYCNWNVAFLTNLVELYEQWVELNTSPLFENNKESIIVKD